jgi:hypothetical protein
MGCEITGNRNEDVPALVGVAPNGELPDSRLQHLLSIEALVSGAMQSKRACDQYRRRKRSFAAAAAGRMYFPATLYLFVTPKLLKWAAPVTL